MLSPRDEGAIRYVLCDAEAYAGLKSSFGQQTDRLALAQLSPNAKKNHAPADPLSLSEMPIKSSGHGVGENRSMGPVEAAACWSSHAVQVTETEKVMRRDVKTAYRALRAIADGTPEEQRALRVLNLVLGPRPPGVDRSGLFDRLWPIALYTDAVEAVRRELVAKEYARQMAHTSRAVVAHNTMAAEFVPRNIVEAIDRPRPVTFTPDMVERIETSAERMVTSGDALRWALDECPTTRVSFVAAVKAQVEAMYAAAEAAFLARRGA